jgi:hypothetical protein
LERSTRTPGELLRFGTKIVASRGRTLRSLFLKPFLADDTFALGKGISEHSAGSDNRLPPATRCSG